MPTMSESPQAVGYVLCYIEVSEWGDAWCVGGPEDPHPWLIRPHKYVVPPGLGFRLFPMPPVEAVIFPTVREAREWRKRRAAYYRQRGEKWRPGPSVLPVRHWMMDRLRPKPAGEA